MVANLFLNASHDLNVVEDESVSNPDPALKPACVKHRSQVTSQVSVIGRIIFLPRKLREVQIK